MILADTSPLIVLGRLNRLDILQELFGVVTIPNGVYQESVADATFPSQSDSILRAIENSIIQVIEPTLEYEFKRKLGLGETGVLKLAIEMQATAIIMDDKRARNEAREMGITLFYTTDILKGAAKRSLIKSYQDTILLLRTMQIFLPE